MKSDIEYYYNIDLDNLTKTNNNYYFKYKNDNYYFVLYLRPIEDLKDLDRVVYELKNKNVMCHEFMLNKDNKLITKIDNLNYIMLKLNEEPSKEIDLFDIINFQNKLSLTQEKSKLYRNNWALLWSKKVDYFEYQINQLGKDKRLILDSFSYYTGLAENAISYVNNIEDTPYYHLTLSHKRIYSPNYALNFYNPLSFIFDISIRDIAEYIKYSFFDNIDAYNILAYYLKNNKLSPYEYKMLYARLLYPSYYFDLYESIMDKLEDEDKLIPIINRVEDYEKFLIKSYHLICNYHKIDSIDWLIKREVI